MSSRVKQANFRLPLEYMAMIDEFAARDNLTKAAVITRALDCMKASYDSGHGGMPITSSGDADRAAEIKTLREELGKARSKISTLEANAKSSAGTTGTDAEISSLKAIITSQEVTIRERNEELAAKDKEIVAKNAEIAAALSGDSVSSSILAEKDARIAALEKRITNGDSKYGSTSEAAMKALALEANSMPGAEGAQALQLFNMLSGVMGAFRQQVEDARMLGIQEGRKAVNSEFKDIVGKARNDGYREAMTYLDERVDSARDAGAKEERARIANMRFFERRRYLRIHFI